VSTCSSTGKNLDSSSHARPSLFEIAAIFLRLGLTSFGGPVAHLGYFQDEIVRRKRWFSDEEYADLVALCHFLPGPASSQFVFATGMKQRGLLGALAASLCFTLPSAIAMILFAIGLAKFGDTRTAGWLHGLKLAAVAVVAQAVWNLGRKLCPDFARGIIAAAAAAVVLFFPRTGIQIAAIAIGALAGWSLYRGTIPVSQNPPTPKRKNHGWAGFTLIAFFLLLIVLPLAAKPMQSTWLSAFDSFYRSGALVFGGGHVVLPLLRAEVVPRGWISDAAFLAGYGAAQAVPDPLFTFAAYLGATIFPDSPWLGGLWCLLGIFLPAWMLIGGALPFWHSLREKAWAQAALRGANAAVVGVLLAALYNPVGIQGVRRPSDAVAAAIAFVLLQFCRVPPWLVVALAAAAGQWILR